MTTDYNQILKFTIALNSGLGLSHHIVNNVVSNLNISDINLESANDFLRAMYPSLPTMSEEHWTSASVILDKHESHNIYSLPFVSPTYPAALKLIKNPPSILYLRGDINILKSLPGAAIVGTRKVTPNGAIIAQRISSFLSQNGWTIISGLAIGIDASAHQGALMANGKTIAVLAHGLHKASPKQNSLLADEILLNGGAWVSEHPWGAEARREYFVHRNRIQIGLSAGSIIVESEIQSGTATQAEFCIQSNRPLFAVVPNSPDNSLSLLSNGPLHLVEHLGAIPIKSKNDYQFILEKLNQSRLYLSR